MNKNKRIYAIVAVIALVLVVGAVIAATHKKSNDSMSMNSTSNNSTAKVDTSGAVATTSVSLANYAFSPAVITVKVGDTVTWTNTDQVHHSVTADTTSADAPSGPLFGQGETYSFKFTKAGTYTYHCMPHPYMHGTVVVTE